MPFPATRGELRTALELSDLNLDGFQITAATLGYSLRPPDIATARTTL